MGSGMNDWRERLKRIEKLLAYFKEEKLSEHWQKDDLLRLQDAFKLLLTEIQQYFGDMQQELLSRGELINLWDEEKLHIPLTKKLFGMDHYRFYKEVWDELNAVLSVQKETEDLYFRVSISAMQLLFLIHLMHEARIVETPKKGNLFRFISKHIGTLQHEELSYESLRKKYHTADRNTIIKVRRLLMDLVNLINNHHL